VAAVPALLEATTVTVAAHRGATPYIDGRTELVKGDRRYDPVDVDLELCEGVRFRTDAGPMEVLFTPGHSPGHICLYFADHGALLAADALTARDGVLAGPPENMTPNWEEALNSVDRLTEYDVQRVLCYHGGPVSAGPEELKRVVTEG
jgi:glyoxylase-like metal-dependent hydrolase (beta-lactamase superfamily II)